MSYDPNLEPIAPSLQAILDLENETDRIQWRRRVAPVVLHGLLSHHGMPTVRDIDAGVRQAALLTDALWRALEGPK